MWQTTVLRLLLCFSLRSDGFSTSDYEIKTSDMNNEHVKSLSRDNGLHSSASLKRSRMLSSRFRGAGSGWTAWNVSARFMRSLAELSREERPAAALLRPWVSKTRSTVAAVAKGACYCTVVAAQHTQPWGAHTECHRCFTKSEIAFALCIQRWWFFK